MATPTQPPSSAPPPDVLLEVGPPPYARYAAHSVLLSAHSGYLRSAMRVPDADRKYDGLIYLHNITAEQFGPLLTYMYTGFLDLTAENIFAVLLASHVLHMPRAAEICRAYLARSQSEGYLGGTFDMHAEDANKDRLAVGGGHSKVVRPIASKASASGLSFVAPPTSSVLLPSRDTPFKSLMQSENSERQSTPIVVEDAVDLIVVGSSNHVDVPDKSSHKKRSHTSKYPSNHKKPASSKATICEVVADPVKFNPDPTKTQSTTIIDIASCDGPVRFHRVLNEAYGRGVAATIVKTPIERSQQHVATSFHLQMAKTISEHVPPPHASSRHSDESENSQEINVSSEAANPEPPSVESAGLSSVVKPSDELYSCVYCKHTFKSQYCYQKHAKRHINPLTIDDTERIVETIDSDSDDRSSSGGGGRRRSVVRREVRPLDMNVQYYPCKTCGSKFPSYYFVHKHRKLCHSTEDH